MSSRPAAFAALFAASLAVDLAIAQSPPGQQASPLPSSAQPTSAVKTAPPFTPVRWNEDYSYLRDPAARTSPIDAIKFIPLSDDGEVYLSLGGQARFRYEYWNNELFGAVENHEGYFLQRYLLHADLHLGPAVRVFVQGKSALVDDGRETPTPRPLDADELDLQQGFVDLRAPLGEKRSATFRAGRQDLLYGAQRLISPLDWANVRRTFDGVKLSTAWDTHVLDVFAVRPVVVDREQFNEPNDDVLFFGVYDTIQLPTVIQGAGTKLELYGLGLYSDVNATTPVGSDTYTVGARFYTNPKPWDVDVEAAYQFGDVGSGGDISAFMFSTEGGYTLVDAPTTPRVYLGFDYASGDSDPADGDRGTFNQLFPLGHAYFGYIDVIGRQNIIAVHPGVELTLLKEQKFARKLTARADYHVFWRAQEEDGLYNAGGVQFRPAGGSDDRFVGTELDLLINWQIDRHFSAYFGYSHFFAGDFIEATGPGDDIDFFYAAVMYTF
jgi:hypothetical protein